MQLSFEKPCFSWWYRIEVLEFKNCRIKKWKNVYWQYKILISWVSSSTPQVKAFLYNLFDYALIFSSFVTVNSISICKYWIHIFSLYLSITYSFYTPTHPWHHSHHKEFFSNDSQTLLIGVCLQVLSLSSSKGLTFIQVSFCAEWNLNVCGDIEILSPWAAL